MAQRQTTDPRVRTEGAREIAPDLVVIPDQGVRLVPNIGVIGGTRAVLVVDTGLGPDSAEEVLAYAAARAGDRRLYLTTTHFHPEHAFGARAFAGRAVYLANRAQAADLAAKGPGYLDMFRGLGDHVARRLSGVDLPAPDVVYEESAELDLGGRVVRLRAVGRAHSRGDQVVEVPDAGVVFTGDLVEAGQFPILPWFPPHDTDVSGTGWIAALRRLAAEEPRTVVPGHGAVGGPDLLADAEGCLRLLRDETWARRDAGMPEERTAAEVAAVLTARYPDWSEPEWIEKGVGCLYTEHPEHPATAEDKEKEG
ncbi:MBL fold metallo-hydrolase [Streptomonospora nanhaiensis]|uniref:MBL fold metallo-hydrolase n=1 Tax=Streptomonospora nanhaiensis TaxID=1323731 RepID=UPI001C390B6F|nr:MBL fold metallo-hydrolase [Streptomonospora nanhaiensis]MBV2364220.1 MBL fold metallo-hydrolase [Streptomonospora nanhaiensis]